MMATMNISLPAEMKAWVEQMSASGRYGNASDYIRDLIRKDQDKQAALGELEALIIGGLESGISEYSVDELRERALKKFREQR